MTVTPTGRRPCPINSTSTNAITMTIMIMVMAGPVDAPYSESSVWQP